MGKEIRMVPENWEHPQHENGNHKPLYDSKYAEEAKDFLEMANEEGLQEAVDYMGCPDSEDYMPDWKPEEKTCLQMYETCSEGTPISPVMKTPEELAKWLADNGASSFGSMTATYEQWLPICKGGYAPSAVVVNGKMVSGVEGMATS